MVFLVHFTNNSGIFIIKSYKTKENAIEDAMYSVLRNFAIKKSSTKLYQEYKLKLGSIIKLGHKQFIVSYIAKASNFKPEILEIKIPPSV